MPCMLDYFPWEILHTIFDYLETIDLLRAFVDVNRYVDTVLHSYYRIQLNFKSIAKSKFYFICEHIHPDQIQSLVLSDDEYTPGQTKLFMSLLRPIQFSNLQYFKIDQIHDVNLLCLMFAHLENHVRLRSLSVVGPQIQRSLKKALSITQILPTLSSLKYLTFMNSFLLISLKCLRQPLSKLTHLNIRSRTYGDLPIPFPWLPNLLHLQISMPFYNNTAVFDYISPHLTSLIIESQNWTLFSKLENILSFTPSLQCFILETRGEQALLDARRWETLIKTKLSHLTKLALSITPEENNMTGDEVLLPFQNPFWTTEKHWDMACLISSVTQSCVRLFSIPHFSPKDEWYPPGAGFFNYSLTPYSFNDHCTELRVSNVPSPALIPSPFKHIQTLSIECTTDEIAQLHQIVNLSSVHHLKFGRSVGGTALNDILQVATNVDQLTINSQTLMEIIDSLPADQHVYEQIKKLEVDDTILNMDINQLCRIFPKLEHVSLSLKERDTILRIFHGLHYLTSASVRWIYPFKTSATVIDERLQKNNICTDGAYRLYISRIYVWID